MREIKFRAWDEDIGVMIYFGLGEDNLGVLSPKDGRFYHLQISDATAIMQFTGLRDRTGKEIYDGDRVLFEISKLFTGPRSSKEDINKYTGTIEWDNEDTGFFILNDSDNWPHIKLYNAEEIEIIGNIYEGEP